MVLMDSYNSSSLSGRGIHKELYDLAKQVDMAFKRDAGSINEAVFATKEFGVGLRPAAHCGRGCETSS